MSLPKLVPSETNYIILVLAIYKLVRALILKFALKLAYTYEDNKIFCVRNLRVRTSHQTLFG